MVEPKTIDIGHKYTVDQLSDIINAHRKLLILSITNKCNMNCTYCIYHDKFSVAKNTDQTMPFEIAKKAIDQFLTGNFDVDEAHIGFYGGESLIEFDLIKKCVDYANSTNHGTKLTFGLTTNGVLLANNEMRNYLVLHGFRVLVSLDGPRRVNDRYRVDKSGAGVYDRVIKNLLIWYNENMSYFKNKVSINAVEAATTPVKVLDDFFSLFPVSYNRSEMIETGYFKENSSCELTPYMLSLINDTNTVYTEQFKQNLLTLFRVYSANGSRPLYGSVLPGGTCIPVYLRCYVNTFGKYYPCERIDESDEFCIGDVETGIDYNKIKEMFDRFVSTAKEKCRGCWALRLCGRCFKNISADCTELLKNIENNYCYYIDNIKDVKKAVSQIEKITFDL